MLTVHTLEVRPTVDTLNESVGEAFLARLRMLIGEAEAPARINLALSGGAVTSSLLPSLLPRVGEVDWSRVRVWMVDERYVPAGDKERNDDQAWEASFTRPQAWSSCACRPPIAGHRAVDPSTRPVLPSLPRGPT